MAIAEPALVPVPGGRLPAQLAERGRRFFQGMPLSGYLALGAVVVVVFVATFAGVLAPHDPTLPVGEPLSAPSAAHLLGTDEIGRDILSRVLVGMGSSWWGAVVVIASGVVFGGLVGLVAGAAGGIVDTVLMRITDVFLALPGPILAVALVAAMGPSYAHTLLGVAIVWWPLYTRLVRAEVRTLRASPHLDAARVAGTSRTRLLLRHLLPGAVPVTIVAASMDVSALVLQLAGLSFLGLGAPAPAPELGSMSARGVTYIFTAWWVPIMPAVGVFVLAVVANLGGDALRDRIRDR